MKRYRIGHVLPWPSVGGTEQATRRIAQATAGAFDHVFYVPEGASELEKFLSATGEVHTYRVVEPGFRRLGAFLGQARHFARQLRSSHIDLLHCADILAGSYTALAGKLAGVKVLCHVRNRHVLSPRERLFLKPVTFFAFVSMDTWRHSDFAPENRGAVIYDGIDIDSDIESSDAAAAARRSVLEELALPDDTILITMAARVAPQKDYVTLIRAAQQLVEKHSNARFVIVGDHEKSETHRKHFSEVEELLARANMTKFFVFTGFRTDVRRFLRATDTFVLSTHFEGLPLVLLEAMSEFKPVVATAVDGIPEIVIDRQTGLSYGHEDYQALARCLSELIEHPEIAASLAATAQSFVGEHFSKEQFAQSMNSLYTRLLEGR